LLKNKSRSKIDNDGLKRIASHKIELSAQEKDNEIVVTTNSHKGTIDLEITNINGNVNLDNISGSAVVNTIDGHIVANFKNVTPEVPMAFSSIEGKIDITFPAEIKAFVKMKSDNGEIFSDFEIEIDKRKTQVNKSDKSGIYMITLEEWTNGKINGGGPDILLKTLEGNIYIRKRN